MPPQLETIHVVPTAWQDEALARDGVSREVPVAQRLKCLPAMQETWVRSLGREDPLQKEMATHSSILAWETPRTEDTGGLLSTGPKRVGRDLATK